MILGSVANAIVRKSACPVLTVAHAPNGPDVACEASAQTACAAWQS
jgi:hypothetical protein